MTEVKRVTANLPRPLLEAALAASGKSITETLVEGLELVRRGRLYETAMRLKGKIDLDVDLDQARERTRR